MHGLKIGRQHNNLVKYSKETIHKMLGFNCLALLCFDHYHFVFEKMPFHELMVKASGTFYAEMLVKAWFPEND